MSEDKKDFDWLDVADLQPWIKNPRFNDVAVVPVANSIEEFGFGAPIVVQAGTNMIIAGHTRLKAAMRLGWKKVPCRILEISDRNAERLAIADNKTNEIADWNEEHLQDILEGFEPEELQNIGFNEEELQQLLQDDEPSSEEEPPPPPKPVNTNQTFTLLKGDCLERLKELEDCSIDSIVTDPPYMINYMSKGWDHEDRDVVDNVELWRECIRVLKHGGHLIGFCATRTIHRMTTVIEEAGFEIRDQLCWCYESGFPKSLNISKQFEQRNDEVNAAKWNGYGTALKPAFEPAVLARKPVDGSIVDNVLKHGVGGLNIEATRFPYGDPIWFGDGSEIIDRGIIKNGSYDKSKGGDPRFKKNTSEFIIPNVSKVGRWPANIVRFKKAQRSEREEGLDHLEAKKGFEAVDRKEGSAGVQNPRAGAGRTAGEIKNFHPTVKPLDLMRWMVRLVTPQNGTVLDPFLGSGTTAAAAMLEGFNAVGCEITEEYWPIIEGRVENAKLKYLEGDQDG